jgi:hypothetical protein
MIPLSRCPRCLCRACVARDGLESSLIPGAYAKRYARPLVLVDRGKRVPLASLIRYHPSVRSIPHKGSIKFTASRAERNDDGPALKGE